MKAALLFACVIASVAAGPASAQTTVLGIELGKPLNYPQCPVDPNAPPPTGQACLQIISGFVLGRELPPYATTLHPVVESGIVVSIEIVTNGLPGEEAAYKGLVQKFGLPTKRQVIPVENQMGARFRNILAVWQKSNYTVMFSGIAGGDPASGVITVSTSAYAKNLSDTSTNKTTL